MILWCNKLDLIRHFRPEKFRLGCDLARWVTNQPWHSQTCGRAKRVSGRRPAHMAAFWCEPTPVLLAWHPLGRWPWTSGVLRFSLNGGPARPSCHRPCPYSLSAQRWGVEISRRVSIHPQRCIYIYICVCYIQYKHKILIYQYINIYIYIYIINIYWFLLFPWGLLLVSKQISRWSCGKSFVDFHVTKALWHLTAGAWNGSYPTASGGG